jgi:predicted enzyme related to lactoylglutathione lyase
MAYPILHFDISGLDEERQQRFYSDLFGWQIEAKGPGYASASTTGLNGALVEADHPSVVLGVGVPDLARAVTTAVELGGLVVMPPTHNGWVTKAQVSDPAGNLISLIQM